MKNWRTLYNFIGMYGLWLTIIFTFAAPHITVLPLAAICHIYCDWHMGMVASITKEKKYQYLEYALSGLSCASIAAWCYSDAALIFYIVGFSGEMALLNHIKGVSR